MARYFETVNKEKLREIARKGGANGKGTKRGFAAHPETASEIGKPGRDKLLLTNKNKDGTVVGQS